MSLFQCKNVLNQQYIVDLNFSNLQVFTCGFDYSKIFPVIGEINEMVGCQEKDLLFLQQKKMKINIDVEESDGKDYSTIQIWSGKEETHINEDNE